MKKCYQLSTLSSIFDYQLNETDMKNLTAIISAIETLEAKRDNFTITFEESAQLFRLVELAETLVQEQRNKPVSRTLVLD